MLAIVVAETRQQARDAADAGRRSATTCMRHRSPIRRRPSTTARRSPCGAPTDNVLSVSEYARGDVDAGLAGSRSHRARGVPDAAHRARLPRAGEHVGGAERSTACATARLLGRPGRVGRPQRHRRACSASSNDQVTVELVSNGGAFGGKEDMSNQAHDRAGRVAAATGR